MMMEDEKGQDEKILAVPVDELLPFYSNVKTFLDLPEILTRQIQHFFEHYKDLEHGKWVKVVDWLGPEEAAQMIRDGLERAKKHGKG